MRGVPCCPARKPPSPARRSRSGSTPRPDVPQQLTVKGQSPSRALNVTSRLCAAGCLPIEISKRKGDRSHGDVSRPIWRGGFAMGIALWVVQVLLAGAFVVSGATKLSQPKEKLLKNWAWVEDFSQGSVRIIGTLEILGAIGILLPELRGIVPWLTPLAALALVLTMIGAAPYAPQARGVRRHRRERGSAHRGRLGGLRAVLRPAGLIWRFAKSKEEAMAEALIKSLPKTSPRRFGGSSSACRT